MTIPLDRLYRYIEHIAEKIHGDPVIIYRFWPHGSKNINDLNNLNNDYNNTHKVIYPHVWCNDQEPLNYEYYKNNLYELNIPTGLGDEIDKKFKRWHTPTNLNYRKNIFEKNLLLHSEQRSCNLENYKKENRLIPVYYWCHAVIARDWFRFAEHENFQKNTKKTFLIYNRAWSNTREYRLCFADLLVENNLLPHCKTNCNAIDPEINLHYNNVDFQNEKWRPKNQLEKFFEPSQAGSHSSADFESSDYNSTDIEVVLETLFDDDRLHLTEKVLRPIACGQPFLLAATHGSLSYLRRYGFKTFDSVWNESYDLTTDPRQRLEAIIDVMKTITEWDELTRQNKFSEARNIADYNRKWFFSKDFWNLVLQELEINLKQAFQELASCDNFEFWINFWNDMLAHVEAVDFINSGQYAVTKLEIDQIMQIAKQKLRESKVQV